MNNIDRTIEVLNSGGVIIYQSDTVIALGCKADNIEAINKIYRIKKRSFDKKFILLLSDNRNLKNYVKVIPEIAWDIIESSDKQPTIIYPNAINLPKILIENDGSIAFRIINVVELNEIINKIKVPLVSTSANISGENVPKQLEEVSNNILYEVDYILNLPKKDKVSKVSSIIKLKENSEVEIIRK